MTETMATCAPLPVAPVNETDMVLVPKGLHALKQVAKEVGLDLRGAYVNLDGGFDSKANRKCMFNTGMIPNMKEPPPQPFAPQARAQTVVQRRHPCVADAYRTNLCVGRQVQATVAPL